MNKKHIGSAFSHDVKKWEKSPVFRKAVEEHKEKTMLAVLLKNIRAQENISQTTLAFKARVPQSVIARIETGSSGTLPRLDLFNRILSSVGYTTTIVATKRNKIIRVALGKNPYSMGKVG